MRLELTDRSVFLTGHTGFKGAWLALWLNRLGAVVNGYALAPPKSKSLFDLADVASQLKTHHIGDIRDLTKLSAAMNAARPEVVFHLAAQALVRPSYHDPITTWETNVIGTVNVLEAARCCPSVRAVVVVTTDKCYENREWIWGYRENDSLGGHDPYSASKAAAELVTQSYRRSFFTESGPLVATARAGNVIGGGDWSLDRLIPDAVRAVESDQMLLVRRPMATRPWQHVVEPLYGYLVLASGLLNGRKELADAYNFGPDIGGNMTVADVLSGLQRNWPEVRWQTDSATDVLHEASCLYLDSSKARHMLDWRPRWNLNQALRETATWYRAVLADPTCAQAMCADQIDRFISEQ